MYVLPFSQLSALAMQKVWSREEKERRASKPRYSPYPVHYLYHVFGTIDSTTMFTSTAVPRYILKQLRNQYIPVPGEGEVQVQLQVEVAVAGALCRG